MNDDKWLWFAAGWVLAPALNYITDSIALGLLRVAEKIKKEEP